MGTTHDNEVDREIADNQPQPSVYAVNATIRVRTVSQEDAEEQVSYILDENMNSLENGTVAITSYALFRDFTKIKEVDNHDAED